MLNAWSNFGELQTLADPKQTPPEKEVIKPLAKHRIESEHSPSLEVLFNNTPFREIKFDVLLSLDLEGFILKVKAGRVTEVKTGSLQAGCTLGALGKTLLERATEPYALAGRLNLDPPFAIPRRT